MSKLLRLWNRLIPGSLPAFEGLPDATAARLLAEGVVNPADISDGASVFGIGSISLLTTVSPGALIANLGDPYAGLGLGTTTYASYGIVPGQLALASSSIVAGLSAPVAGQSYSIGILATSGDGKRRIGETVTFGAAAPSTGGGTTPTLGTLTLSGVLNAGTASTGTINSASAGSTITATGTGFTVNSAARTYAFDGTAAAGASLSLIETLSGASNSPNTTPITVAAAGLNALSLSPSNFTTGSSASGSINGATAGSTITSTNLPSGLTINSAARTFFYSGATIASPTTITLVETPSGGGATRSTDIQLTFGAASAVLSALTLAPTSVPYGTAYSGTIGGSTAGSTLASSAADGAPLTTGSGQIAGRFLVPNTTTVSIVESLSSATNSPKRTDVSLTISGTQSYLRGLLGASLLRQFVGSDANTVDQAAGAVARWGSSSGKGTLVQATVAAQPAFSTNKAVFVSANSQRLFERGAEQITVSAVQSAPSATLPDVASSVPGKGFTCTGLYPVLSGGVPQSWWIGNDGRFLAGDSSVLKPSIVQVSADFKTKVSEVVLADLGIADGTASAQGVAVASDGTVYVALPRINAILHIDPTKSGTARLIGRQNFPSPNGLTIDLDRNLLVAMTVTNDGSSATVDGVTLAYGAVRWIPLDAGDWGTTGKTFSASLVQESADLPTPATGYAYDHIFYSPESHDLYYTLSKNGVDGQVVRYDVRQKINRRTITFSGALATEGVYILGNTAWLPNDAYYHDGTAYLNQVLTYTLPDVPSVWAEPGTQFALAGVWRQPSTNASAKYAVTAGEPLDTTGHFGSTPKGGFGMGFAANSATSLIFKVNGATTLTFTGAVTAAATFLYVLQVDLIALTASLFVNGTQVGSAQSIAALNLASCPRAPMLLGANIEGLVTTRFMDVEISEQLLTVGVLDTTTRQKIEGDLAARYSLQANLPAGHPYKSAAPV